MQNNLFFIAQSGWRYIAYTTLAFVIFQTFDFEFLSVISFIILLGLLFLYRNPERVNSNYKKGSIVSPVDGIVKSIVELDDKEFAYKVEIDSSCFNVGILRTPCNASIQNIKIVRGTRISRKSKLFDILNEYALISFRDESGHELKIVHKLKQGFAPIDIDLISKQTLNQGSRYGVAINAVTWIYLPSNTRLNIKVAQELKGSETLLAYFS